MIKAAHRFDEKRGYKFISYAVWWIRQAMLQSLAEHSRIVRLPLNRAGTLYRIGKASRQLDQELGRAPSAREIAKKLKLSEEEVEDTMHIANTHVSLDDPYSTRPGRHVARRLPPGRAARPMPDEETYERALSDDMEKALGDALGAGDGSSSRCTSASNGEEPLTLEEIGKELGLTRERIRQIKEKAIMRLRHSSRAKFLQGYMEG